MRNWKTILETDHPNLTENNHIQNLINLQDIISIYRAQEGIQGHTLKETLDFPVNGGKSEAIYSSKGNPFQYAIHVSSDGSMYWENIEDFLIRRQALNGRKLVMYKTGYIDGLYHHLGKVAGRGMLSASAFPGYKLWMEITTSEA